MRRAQIKAGVKRIDCAYTTSVSLKTCFHFSISFVRSSGLTLAMLVRRNGESQAQLLTRLDQAVAKALGEDIYTDEINSTPESLLPHNQSCPFRKLVDTTSHSTTTDHH